MRRVGFAAASVLALAACAPQVPDSAAGVGFGDYGDYAARQAQIRAERNLQLADAMTIRPPEATGAPSAVATASQNVTSAELAAAGIGTATPTPAAPTPAVTPEPVISPAAPVITPAVGAPLDATGTGYAAAAAPQALASAQAVTSVGARETTAGSATGVPARPTSTGPDIVAYALESAHPVGRSLYPRTLPMASRAARRCAAYASDDMAQLAFLEAGGPAKDRHGIDPDGDGYACGWDPTRYRRAVGG